MYKPVLWKRRELSLLNLGPEYSSEESLPLCFEESVEAHQKGQISIDEHLGNLLAHVLEGGSNHRWDDSYSHLMELVMSDPVAGAIKLWILDPVFSRLSKAEVSSLKMQLGDIYTKNHMVDETSHAVSETSRLVTLQSSLTIPVELLAQVFIAAAFAVSKAALIGELLKLPPPKKSIFDIMDMPSLAPEYLNIQIWTEVLQSSWFHQPENPSHRDGLMKLLKDAFSPECERSQFDVFIHALKSRNVQPPISIITGLVFSNEMLSTEKLTSLLKLFPQTLSSPPEDGGWRSQDLLRFVAKSTIPNKFDVIVSLLDLGLDPNWMPAIDTYALALKQDPFGTPWGLTDRETALHIAAEKGDLKMVELLLGRGAQKGIIDGLGKTAEDRALNRAKDDVVQMLRKHETLKKDEGGWFKNLF